MSLVESVGEASALPTLVFQARGFLMDPNLKTLQLRGLLIWVTGLVGLFLVGSIIPDWLINTLIGLVIFMFTLPVVGIFGLRWWVQRNVVVGDCPVCSAPVQGWARQPQLNCPSCGTPLEIAQGTFVRLTPPGVVDVRAVDVIDVSVMDD
jgi:hypothetical protein